MDEVQDLLRIWELPELIPVFVENEMILQALSAMTADTIADLIPKIGPRVLFLRCWKSWQTEFSSTNVTLSGLEEDDAGSDIVDPNQILSGCVNQDDNNDNLVIIEIENDVQNQILNGDNEQNPQQQSPARPPKYTTSPVLDTSDSRALEKLLKQSLEGSVLLAYKGGSIDGNSARNLLVAEIAKEILRTNKNNTIRGEVYCKWSNAIKALFPLENTITYYVPACTTAYGVTLPAKGKLVYQVLNQRKRLQKLGALTSRKRSNIISSDTSQISSRASPRPPPSLLDSADGTENIDEDLNWLRNSSDPWSIVLVKWKNTVKERMRKLHEQNHDLAQTIESYFEEFPALKKPHGYILLNADFDVAYSKFTDNLFINYPLVKNSILTLLMKRKKEKDVLRAELLELWQSNDEESKNLAGFLAIPHLLSLMILFV